MGLSKRLMAGVCAALVCSGLFAGCDLSGAREALDDFVLVIELEPIETVVVGQVLDAATGELVADDVRLTFSGAHGSELIDLFSDPLAQQTVRGGLVSFGIRNTVVPAQERPVTFEVHAEATGYQPGHAAVRVTARGEHRFEVYLLDLRRPPAGVAGTAAASFPAGADGRLPAPHTVSTPPEPYTGARASLLLPEGAALLGPAGVLPAAHGAFVYYGNQSWSSLRFFPTPFTAPPVGAQGPVPGTAFVTAGFVHAAFYSADGTPAAGVTHPARLTVEIPTGTPNPRTGAPLQAGDAIGTFYLDGAAKGWTPTGDRSVEAGPNGLLQVSLDVPLLGWWSLGWLAETCRVPTTLQVNRNGQTAALDVGLSTTGFFTFERLAAHEDRLVLATLPSGLHGALAVYAAGGTVPLDFAFCGGQYHVDLPPPPAGGGGGGAVVDAHVTVVPRCPNPAQGVRLKGIPTAAILYRRAGAPAGTPWRQAGLPAWTYDEQAKRLLQGEVTIPGVEQGAVYTFTTTYQGQSHSRDVLITGPEMTIEETVDASYCQ